MIQVAIGVVETVAYLTDGYAVGELTEYHAHKVTLCLKPLGCLSVPCFLIRDLIKSFGNCWIS